MELNRLDLDTIKYVLDYLDIKSLILLHSTFDRRILKSIQSPNTVRYLPYAPYLHRNKGELWHFYKSIRDIGTLKLTDGWGRGLELESLGILSLWNPLAIVAGDELMSISCFSHLARALRTPKDQSLQRFMPLMRPIGVPDLERLTPRLQSLFSTAYSFVPYDQDFPYRDYIPARQPTAIALPPSLTALSIQAPTIPGIFNHMPSSLTSISVGPIQRPLSEIFARFPYLESFDCCSSRLPVPMIPVSLTHLGLEEASPNLFQKGTFPPNSSLTSLRVTIHLASSSPIDTCSMASVLPQSLVKIHLEIYKEAQRNFLSISSPCPHLFASYPSL